MSLSLLSSPGELRLLPCRFFKNIEIFFPFSPNITYVILPYKQSFIITCIIYQYWKEEYPGGGRAHTINWKLVDQALSVTQGHQEGQDLGSRNHSHFQQQEHSGQSTTGLTAFGKSQESPQLCLRSKDSIDTFRP